MSIVFSDWVNNIGLKLATLTNISVLQEVSYSILLCFSLLIILTFVLGYINENNHSQNSSKSLLFFIFFVFKQIDCINDNNNACTKFKYKSKP